MVNKSIAKNYIYNMIHQILVAVVPLITTPYISRVLGAESIGIYSYTASICAYFILFGSFGIVIYGQREIAYCQENEEKRSKIFYEIILLRLITLIISILIFYFGFAITREYSMYYKILVVEMIANIFDIGWFFQGIEDFKKAILRIILVRLVAVCNIFIFVKSTKDLPIYLVIQTFSSLVGNISLWVYLPKYIKKIDVKKINIIKHLIPTISLFIPQIAIQMYTVLDKIIIGNLVVDKSEVGFYEQSQKLIKMLLIIVTSLSTVLIPRIANAFANGHNDKLNKYVNKSFNFTLMMAFPLMFGVVSIANKFIPIFYGDGFDRVVILINIISPIVLMIGLSNVVGMQYLLPTKRQKEFTISVIIGAIVSVILNLILIGRYQSIGAAIAIVITEATVTIIQLYLIRKEISIYKIIKMGKNYFFAGIIMFICTCLVNFFINDYIMAVIIQVCVGIATYFGILMIMKDRFFCENLYKFMRKFR